MKQKQNETKDAERERINNVRFTGGKIAAPLNMACR